MRLKQRQSTNFDIFLKRILKKVYKGIFNKKTKILVSVLVLVLIFFVGGLAGLFVTGFFGTLDNPSEKTIQLLHYFNIEGAYQIKKKISFILNENIKIPYNYIAGKIYSHPEKIYIDIDFEDYQKIVYHRNQALKKGIILEEDNEYVSATITNNDKTTKVRLRLKGDWIDHLEGDKWSFRIKVQDDKTLFGMRTFSIQDPKTREYLYEPLYHMALRREGIMAIRYNFIDVTINGNHKGIYALEEHFDKYLAENNEKREGVYLKFDENGYREYLYHEKLFTGVFSGSSIYLNPYAASPLTTFRTNQVLADPIKKAQFDLATSNLESFRLGKLKTHEVIDIDILARYSALGMLLGSQHATKYNNIRFYYNPITSLLEPIGYDGSLQESLQRNRYKDLFIPSCIDNSNNEYIILGNCEYEMNYYNQLFGDSLFFEKYMQELERIGNKEYLESLLKEIDKDLKKDLLAIHSDTPSYHFSTDIFYQNIEYIDKLLNSAYTLHSYYQGVDAFERTIELKIANLQRFPIEIIDATYNDSVIFENILGRPVLQPVSPNVINHNSIKFRIPAGFVWNESYVPNLKVRYRVFGTSQIKTNEVFPWGYLEEDFLEESILYNSLNITNATQIISVDNATKTIQFKEGYFTLNETLLIPKGYTVHCASGTKIDLINSAGIISYSPILFYGTEKAPIEIISSDNSGQGLIVFNAGGQSILENVEFKGLTNLNQGGWTLTGAVNFYESPIIINHVLFSESHSEDSLNIIRSSFVINNTEFKDSFSDCLDIDFGKGVIENSLFINCGNDGADFSGSEIKISNVEIINAGDKGISAGEKSIVEIYNTRINKSNICIASKDISEVYIENFYGENCNYGFALYQKKPEFGPANINAVSVTFINTNKNYLVEKDSILTINDSIIIDTKKNVYDKLISEQLE